MFPIRKTLRRRGTLAALLAVLFRKERIDNIKYSPEIKLRCMASAAYSYWFAETENRDFVQDKKKVIDSAI
jgi:hypothetical protein